MNIKQYLDSTYLKTPAQAGISEEENAEIVKQFVREAIDESFKLIMIRPWYVAVANQMVKDAKSTVGVGTVIGFPEGTASTKSKLEEAEKAIEDGADELDFVCNYSAFKNGDTDLVKEEIRVCTQLGLSHLKTVKWIIEVAALNEYQIVCLSAMIKNIVMSNFAEINYFSVFVKSSTGFYPTENGRPNGATVETIIMMLENAAPLPIKAAGGIRTFEEAVEMINLGVKRIGTSAAKAIANHQVASGTY